MTVFLLCTFLHYSDDLAAHILSVMPLNPAFLTLYPPQETHRQFAGKIEMQLCLILNLLI